MILRKKVFAERFGMIIVSVRGTVRMRVLILEDNEKTRKALVKIVRSCTPDGEICDFGKRVEKIIRGDSKIIRKIDHICI